MGAHGIQEQGNAKSVAKVVTVKLRVDGQTLDLDTSVREIRISSEDCKFFLPVAQGIYS